LALAAIGIQSVIGQQPPIDPGVVAAQRLEKLTGSRCFTTGKILVALPDDLEERAAALGVRGGWVVPDEVFKGSIDDLAASKAGTVASKADGVAWLDMALPNGQIQGWQVVEAQGPKGTLVWLVVGRTVGTACPSGE
jgi:hypothetical protein